MAIAWKVLDGCYNNAMQDLEQAYALFRALETIPAALPLSRWGQEQCREMEDLVKRLYEIALEHCEDRLPSIRLSR